MSILKNEDNMYFGVQICVLNGKELPGAQQGSKGLESLSLGKSS